MKRRSKLGGEPPKGQRPRASKPRRGPISNKASRPSSSVADQQGEAARVTRELNEALRRETSEVLEVIRRSSGELEPVFEAILEKAITICDAKFGSLFRFDGKTLRPAAQVGAPSSLIEAQRRLGGPVRGSLLERVMKTKQVNSTADAAADRFPGLAAQFAGARSIVGVPMLRDDMLIGAIVVYRQEVRPFDNKQISLLTNFAAQAVIAIENARLLSELRQSLEQQTATSEVLQVISASPGELEPVFTTMLEKAVRICDAKYGSLYLHEDGKLRLVAAHDVPEFLEARRGVAFEPAPGGGLDEAMRTKRAIQIPDLAATKPYLERHPGVVEAVELAGIRTGMTVPMLKDDQVIGVIAIHRREVLAFTGKQVELLTNFAAQAVIAIENARLLNELRQSLEQQTATSDVLRVISSSPGELEPVFQAMLENAVRICDAKFGNIYRAEADGLRMVATHNTSTVFAEALRNSGPQNPVRLMMKKKALVHVADVAATEAYAKREPIAVAAVELGGTRTLIIVPMLKDNELVGAFTLARQEVRPFTDKQIALVTNFAAQAVIAIENERLLQELRERTAQLEAQSQELANLNQQLEQRVTDQVGEIERMGRLRRFLPPQVADLIVASGSEKQLESHRREITALFCDLRGFTGFTESADAEDVMALLRDYHAAIGEIIIKYNGTLERYAGDGVMVR
jgi:GAF domain-containing protein